MQSPPIESLPEKSRLWGERKGGGREHSAHQELPCHRAATCMALALEVQWAGGDLALGVLSSCEAVTEIPAAHIAARIVGSGSGGKDQESGNPQLFCSPVPVADMKALLVGKECPHTKEKSSGKQNKVSTSTPPLCSPPSLCSVTLRIPRCVPGHSQRRVLATTWSSKAGGSEGD